MTNNEGTSANDEEPFQVVLIDMKKAAQGDIHCVEKPLMGSGDLKYVAISYRWGEFNETVLDTGLGYVATITSFALQTLMNLCKIMTQERDLKSMDYVWVDAICVDQTNYDRRKTTIYHMTDIYERANYIVAVPDLHFEYLRAINGINQKVMAENEKNAAYIYHLLRGNVAQLDAYDQTFLDECCVPNDPHLRHLLINYTLHFAKAFIKHRYGYVDDDEGQVVRHLLATHSPIEHRHHNHDRNMINNHVGSDEPIMDDLDKLTIDELHTTCNDWETCPLKLFFVDDKFYNDGSNDLIREHCQTRIPNRSRKIRQSITLLKGLVEDWSTRAWVVSEFHIAKTKSNKMKYWFMQLETNYPDPQRFHLDEYIFFEFEFKEDGTQIDDWATHYHAYAVLPLFHSTMQQQLNQLTFLEKLLKTKASRNVDRFHAILPSSEYKHILTNKELVDSWNITSLASARLQLYKWMTTKDKLELFFLAGSNESSYVLPTFATTTILWPRHSGYPMMRSSDDDDDGPCNFDLTRDDAITLIKEKGSSLKLNVKPLGYYRREDYRKETRKDLKVNDMEMATVRKLLCLSSDDALDYICIHDFGTKGWRTSCVYLLGNLIKNKWVIKCRPSTTSNIATYKGWHYHSLDKNDIGFDIY